MIPRSIRRRIALAQAPPPAGSAALPAAGSAAVPAEGAWLREIDANGATVQQLEKSTVSSGDKSGGMQGLENESAAREGGFSRWSGARAGGFRR